jgi:hypothetical protein
MPDFQQILEAVTRGDYKAGAALLIVLLVQTLKIQGAKKFPLLGNGYVAFLCAVAIGVGLFALTALAPTITLTAALLVSGAEAGFIAAGGWSGFKALSEAAKASKLKAPEWPEGGPPPAPPAPPAA